MLFILDSYIAILALGLLFVVLFKVAMEDE